MSTRYTLLIGMVLIVLAALSFILTLFNTPDWLYYVGVIFMTLGIVSLAVHYLALKGSAQPASRNTPAPTAQNMPPPAASDLLRDAQQSTPQAPLKERQTPQERAFPPEKDQQP